MLEIYITLVLNKYFIRTLTLLDFLPQTWIYIKIVYFSWKIVIAIVTQKVFTIYLEGNSQYWEISQKSVVETLRKI